MGISCMDQKKARLAAVIQLVDIDDLLDGLYDDDDPPEGDARDSFQLLRDNLEIHLEVLEQQVLTLKIFNEEHDNNIAFFRLLAEERQAIEDHALAIRLDGLAVNQLSQEVSLCDETECAEDVQWDITK
jgi:hypothetical protein